jgi:hypothetical protein
MVAPAVLWFVLLLCLFLLLFPVATENPFFPLFLFLFVSRLVGKIREKKIR